MTTLAQLYDCLLLDLDGTVFRGHEATEGAVDALAAVTSRKLYVTNNASRSPAEVADHLDALGFSAHADDVVTNSDGSIDVFTSFSGFYAVRNALEAAGFAPADAEIVMLPTTSAELDLEGAEKVLKLIDMLEDLDDVQNVYSNAEIPDAVLEQLA